MSFKLTNAGEFSSTKVDASTGPFTDNLITSTNSGQVKLYTNIDLTNAASLTVTAGDTLNGVLDGTFLFSNYAEGTQFRADEVAGGWVVSVVGASTENGLSYITAKPTSDQSIDTLDSTDNMPFTDTIDIGGSGIVNNGDGSFTLSAGRYKLTAAIAYTADGGEITNPNFRWYDVTNSAFVGSQSFQVDFTGDSSPKLNDPVAIVEITVSTDFALRPTVNVDNNISDLQQESHITIEQLPTTEAVLAGMVTPTSLEYLTVAVDGSNVATVSDGTYFRVPFNAIRGASGGLSLANNKVSLTAGKRYKLSALIITDNEAELAFWDFTNDTALSDSFNNADTKNVRGSFTCIVEPSSTVEVGVVTRVSENINDVTNSSFGTLIANGSASWMVVEQLPTSTVVMPDAISVNDQATSGYMDIGDMRMQWGSEVSSAGQFITFPVPFANATYTITGSPADSSSDSQMRTIEFAGRTTTDVQVDYCVFNGGGAAVFTTTSGNQFSWMAIGLKP